MTGEVFYVDGRARLFNRSWNLIFINAVLIYIYIFDHALVYK